MVVDNVTTFDICRSRTLRLETIESQGINLDSPWDIYFRRKQDILSFLSAQVQQQLFLSEGRGARKGRYQQMETICLNKVNCFLILSTQTRWAFALDEGLFGAEEETEMGTVDSTSVH